MDSVKCESFECIHDEYCAGRCIDCAGYGCCSCKFYFHCPDDQKADDQTEDPERGVLIL